MEIDSSIVELIKKGRDRIVKAVSENVRKFYLKGVYNCTYLEVEPLQKNFSVKVWHLYAIKGARVKDIKIFYWDGEYETPDFDIEVLPRTLQNEVKKLFKKHSTECFADIEKFLSKKGKKILQKENWKTYWSNVESLVEESLDKII